MVAILEKEENLEKMIGHSFYKGKRVLVTGHTGFVGVWLSMILKYFGADVCGMALPEEEGSLFERVKDYINVPEVLYDLRDYANVEKVLDCFKPEIVIHLAAFGFIQECLADPLRAFSTNVDGTINLLNAINNCECVKSIIIFSSDKVYRNVGDIRLFSEEDELGGIDPYSASKTCEDITAESFYETYFKNKEIGMVIVRPSNILGGGDHHDNRLIPSIFNNMMNGQRMMIRHPDSVRPWQSILDVCDAVLLLAEKAYTDRKLSIYNVGPNPSGVKSVKEIVEIVADICCSCDSIMDSEGSTETHEHSFLGLSIAKIERELNWKPKHDLETILKNVYECYNVKDDIYNVCMGQIEEYYRED